MSERVVIGNATLYHGDCLEILPTLPKVDAVITDPPYSEETHAGHDAVGGLRTQLGYRPMTREEAGRLAGAYVALCGGWVVWMTDHRLVPTINAALEQAGRYVFAPLPFFQPGRSVRITGDGPCSWTDWICVARTAAQFKWGTLPGGYVAGPGWKDKARMGGKPTLLMDALVGDYSRPGDLVLDTHMGAGTTGVACARAGRRFIGCEIDRAAFDIACERISRAQAQGQMFEPEPVKQEQPALFTGDVA